MQSYYLWRILVCTILLYCQLHAGAWSRKPGELSLKSSLLFHRTTERFSTGGGRESLCLLERSPGCFLHSLESGKRIPIFDDLVGAAVSRAIFFDAEYGLFHNTTLGAKIGYFASENDFDVAVSASTPTHSRGFSDLSLSLKYQYFQIKQAVFSLNGSVKAPTAGYNRNAFGVSLGEGGWSYALRQQVGISLWPLPAYMNAELGYRWRAENEAQIDFGDEWLYSAEAGVHILDNLMFKLAAHGLIAGDDRQNIGIGEPTWPGREVHFLAPALLFNAGSYSFEAGLEYALAGQNYINGTKFNFGVARTFEMF